MPIDNTSMLMPGSFLLAMESRNSRSLKISVRELLLLMELTGLDPFAVPDPTDPALLRLEQMGWITSKWGVSDNNRRAKFYSITRAGRKQLATEAENWERIAGVVARFMKPSGESA